MSNVDDRARRGAARPGRSLLAAVLVLVLVLAGCSSGDQSQGATGDVVLAEGRESRAADGARPADPDTTGPEGPATETTIASTEALGGPALEEVLARRYEAFWEAFDDARESPSAEPTTDHAELADLATGAQLDQAYAELEDMATTGRAQRDPLSGALPGLDHEQSIRIRVDQIEDGSAQLTACLVNDRVSYQVDDGAVINEAVITVLAEATMVQVDGTWKLLRSRAIGLEAGVGGCWDEGTAAYPW